MISRYLPVVSRWTAAAVLVVLLPFLKPPFALAALVLLGMQLGLARTRPAVHDAYEVVVALLHAAALPFVAGSIWPAGRPVALLALVGLPWLAAALRRLAGSVVEGRVSPVLPGFPLRMPGGWLAGRQATPLLLALVAGLLIQALVGVAAERWILLGTSVVILIFLGILVAVSYFGIPPGFLTARAPVVRVLARDTVETGVRLASGARLPVGILIEAPFAWVTVAPAAFAIARKDLAREDLAREDQEVRLRMTPPLAGPGVLTAAVTAIDPWGLTATRLEVDLVRLRVIPRAAYAAWLARRYLESAEAGGHAAMTLPALGRGRGARRGLEYYGARSYEPGDVLRDIFWKHTLKLNRLVMKERRDDYGETVVVTANLGAPDAEAADWIAYSLLMSALTLAHEGVPMAFAAYTARGVVAVTPPLSPRPAVMQALSLVEGLRVAPPPARVLRPSRIALLRRTISRLAQLAAAGAEATGVEAAGVEATGAEPAARLARVLAFEYEARLCQAREHPAAATLGGAAVRVSAPAAVLVISSALKSAVEEADALDVALERLGHRGFHPVGVLVPDGMRRVSAAASG